MPTTGTATHDFMVHVPGEMGRSCKGGRLTLTNGAAYIRTPFLIVDVVNANLMSKIGVPTEAVIVDVYEESGSMWVRFTCGNRTGDVVCYTIWGRQ